MVLYEINCGSQQHYAIVYNEYINFRDPIYKIKNEYTPLKTVLYN